MELTISHIGLGIFVQAYKVKGIIGIMFMVTKIFANFTLLLQKR